MKVFALGGAGTYGRMAAQLLAASDVVSEIVIAGRNLDGAERAAAELGGKASAVQVDVLEEGRLASLAAGSDLVVNTAGPESRVVVPALREAIKAGVHYCDLCCHGPVTEEALTLDDDAKAAGITALLGIGLAGLTNLMMVHAASQLDRTDELRLCFYQSAPVWGYEPDESLTAWQETGHVDASWQTIWAQVVGTVRLYRDGHWVDVDPLEDATRVTLPGGEEVTAHPIGLSEPITVPRVLPDVRSVSVVQSVFPPQVGDVFYDFGRRVACGELSESEAAVSFFEYEAALPKDPIAPPRGGEEGFVMWVEAVGTRQSKRTCYRCWESGEWITTGGPLATAALKILRGEIGARGVLAPESCLDPMPFFAEVAQLEDATPPDGRFLAEEFEVLG